MKLVGIGLNYKKHIEEFNIPKPSEPVIFLMPDSALLRNNEPFYYPDFSANVHYEVELVVKICKVGKNIEPQFASRYYNEIGVGIDFTARDLQDEARKMGMPWELSKGFDSASPISREFIATSDIKDVNDINFSLKLNDTIVQVGNSSDMLFKIDELISYISRYFTLKIGDYIFTGTPSGVGSVKIGDHLQAYIEDRNMLDFWVK